jgi:hypothetical protein
MFSSIKSSLTAIKKRGEPTLLEENDNDSSDDDNESEISAARESPDTDEYLSNWEDDVSSPCLDNSYEKVNKYRDKLLTKEDKIVVTNKVPISVTTPAAPSTPPSSSTIGLDLATVLSTPKKLQDLFKLVIEDDTDDIKEKVKKLVEAEKRVHNSPKVAKTKIVAIVATDTPKETSVHSIEMIPLPPIDGVEPKMTKESAKIEEIIKKVETIVPAAGEKVTTDIDLPQKVASVVTAATTTETMTKPVPEEGEHFEEKLADEYESFMKALNDSVEEEVKDSEPFLQPKLKSDVLPDQSEIADETPTSVDDSSSDDDDDGSSDSE